MAGAMQDLDFNPHSRKGSDGNWGCVIYLSQISIHTPARGVTSGTRYSLLLKRNFNPHSRKGSDGIVDMVVHNWELISIHTPARGVTLYFFRLLLLLLISIHTPARGVTRRGSGLDGTVCISIHTPARGVTQVQNANLIAIRISIHTPARGVTQVYGYSHNGSNDFNPHSRKGSDRRFYRCYG